VQLARQHAKLILSARREDVLQEIAEQLKLTLASNDDVAVLPLDLDDLDALDAKAQKALSTFGRIDVLVNNGGYSSRALARDTASIDIDSKMMRVNFLSYVALTKSLLPSMLENKQGHIINISSLAGKFGSPLRTLYCGAKHAVIGWFDALRAEEAALQSGIVVTNICPGSVKTDVAINAVNASGDKRGYSDPNIDNGLDVSFACDRILAAAHNGLDEAWIAHGKELLITYISQYLPDLAKKMIKGSGREIIKTTMGEEFMKPFSRL